MPDKTLPDWERVLSAAARLQTLLPGAVLVGGTAAAIYASHRLSTDADHILVDLKTRFDSVLADLESVAGWKTARLNRPVMILGSLDGIETGVRQLIRTTPLETRQIETSGVVLTVPTEAELVRIKAALILRRNATRDFLDLVALADHLGREALVVALKRFDELYPQPNSGSALLQLQIQLSNALPFDLDESRLAEYKSLDPNWHRWADVKIACLGIATLIFDRIISAENP